MKSYDSLVKILLLGDSSVGKTCLLPRYVEDTFPENIMSTIGLDYRCKMVSSKGGKKIKLQIWDTAGQDRFRAITQNYYKRADGVVLIYDVTNENTFNNIQIWVNQIKENANQNVQIALVGNKIDSEKRVVTLEQGKELSERYNTLFYEVSAKKNEGVSFLFENLSDYLYNNSLQKEKEKNISLHNEEVKSKKKCCK
jgi:small GTP-binding protein